MKSNPTTNKTTINKPTKATKNRITALILALLLSLTVLSPTIPVKAQDTTSDGAGTTQNNGGTSAGAGDNLPVDSDSDASFSSYIHYTSKAGSGKMTEGELTYSVSLKGTGHFNVRSVEHIIPSNNQTNYYVYIFSDKSFSINISRYRVLDGDSDTISNFISQDCSSLKSFGSSSYYWTSFSIVTRYGGETISIKTPNLKTYTESSNFDSDNLIVAIENTLDLSKDDYLSDEDKANMTPVRDPSIGYLPRARYFDDRKKHADPVLGLSFFNRVETTATIQWDSFQEPYATDLDNPYYVEIYAKVHYRTAHRKENDLNGWELDNSPTVKTYQYKKYGEIKYVAERSTFPYLEPIDKYLQTLDVLVDASGNKVNPDSDTNISSTSCYVSDYFVRLVHYDYEKQQLLCGGFTKLTLNDEGGSTSSEGDFTYDDEPDKGDWTPEDPDKDPDEWDDTGNEKDPDKPNPDNPDFGIDTSDIGKFILSLVTSLLNSIKSILVLVGDFPSLCKHIFSFLPNDIGTLMFCGVSAVIFLRFLGR